MNRTVLLVIFVALIAIFLGIATSAAVFALVPSSGSAPSIYDDFNWSSTANGFWHVNPDGANASIQNGILRLTGHSIELDRRIQTDPYATVATIRVRGHKLHKFGFGLGVYHAGTVGMELDDDGIKCGRGTDHGYKIDIMTPWKGPQTDKWFTLKFKIVNPYPTKADQDKVKNVDAAKLKKVTIICAAYDASGHLIARDVANDPPSNAGYSGLDEAYVRTWDSANDYRVDWFYAGPESGSPR